MGLATNLGTPPPPLSPLPHPLLLQPPTLAPLSGVPGCTARQLHVDARLSGLRAILVGHHLPPPPPPPPPPLLFQAGAPNLDLSTGPIKSFGDADG